MFSIPLKARSTITIFRVSLNFIIVVLTVVVMLCFFPCLFYHSPSVKPVINQSGTLRNSFVFSIKIISRSVKRPRQWLHGDNRARSDQR